MPTTVTLNVQQTNKQINKPATVQVENKSLINCIFPNINNNTITEAQLEKLQEIARKNGDACILEQCDLGAEEKLQLAVMNNFSKYYDITLSDDNKYFKVKIKDAGMFCKNPNLGVIKDDFGLKDGVLVQQGNIPHGNEDVIPKSSYGAGYDNVELQVGDVINIPVSEINIEGTPKGGFGRFISWMF